MQCAYIWYSIHKVHRIYNIACFFSELNPEWGTFDNCWKDINCSRTCVKAYHNSYGSACASLKGITEANLTCADYAQIHSAGPNSCGNPDLEATEMIKDMTYRCDCMSKYRYTKITTVYYLCDFLIDCWKQSLQPRLNRSRNLTYLLIDINGRACS